MRRSFFTFHYATIIRSVDHFQASAHATRVEKTHRGCRCGGTQKKRAEAAQQCRRAGVAEQHGVPRAQGEPLLQVLEQMVQQQHGRCQVLLPPLPVLILSLPFASEFSALHPAHRYYHIAFRFFRCPLCLIFRRPSSYMPELFPPSDLYFDAALSPSSLLDVIRFLLLLRCFSFECYRFACFLSCLLSSGRS